MISYEGIVKRSVFKSSNGTLYSVLSDGDGKKCFVQLYTPKEFGEERKFCDEECKRLLESTTVDMDWVHWTMDKILDLNEKILRLRETAEFMKALNPNNEIIGKVLSKSIQELQDNIDIITSAYAEVSMKNPQYAYNYKVGLFEVPGAVGKIIEGKEEFKDKYGLTVYETNYSAYRSLLVRDMMLGKDEFSVDELTRAKYGKDWNKTIEEKYNEKINDQK